MRRGRFFFIELEAGGSATHEARCLPADTTMGVKRTFETVDEYIESQPEAARKPLLALRAIILRTVPDATELINYDMPAYALVKGGKRDKQIMISGNRAFVGFYPGAGILEHFSKQLVGFKVGKASVQFPHDRPLPEPLIVEIIECKKAASTAR